MSLLKAAARHAQIQGSDPARVAALAQWSAPSRGEAWRYFPLRQVLTRNYAVDLPEGAALPVPELGAVIDLQQDPLPASLRLHRHAAAAATAASGFAGLLHDLAGQVHELEVLTNPGLPLRLRREAGRLGLHAQRWRIRVGAGVQVVLLDELNAPADAWSGDELELELQANAQVLLLRCVDDAASAVRQSFSQIRLAGGAQLQWFGVEARAGICRHELGVQLLGEQASASVRGGGLLAGKSYSETRLELDHRHPGADTSTLWKLVGTEQSRGVFNGRIAIAAGADRSDAQLRTASLLLSEQAEIDVKPELEIHADEVSASHGATVGQLDERALFYLRSRGIARADARRMLTEAFLRELFEAVPEGPARVLVDQALAHTLPRLDGMAA